MDSVLQIIKSKPWIALVAGGILTLIIAIATQTKSSIKLEASPDSDQSVDTFIPMGMVLVPIEVYNYESLDSVLGNYGVVDLFFTNSQGMKSSRPAARRVKILRAPKNPSQFAVLVPDIQAPELVRSATPFYVVIQNPQARGTKFEKRQVRKTQILYDGD